MLVGSKKIVRDDDSIFADQCTKVGLVSVEGCRKPSSRCLRLQRGFHKKVHLVSLCGHGSFRQRAYQLVLVRSCLGNSESSSARPISVLGGERAQGRASDLTRIISSLHPKSRIGRLGLDRVETA